LLAEFESAQLIFSRVLDEQRRALERRLDYWAGMAPWLIAAPVVLSALLVLLSRLSLQRGFVRPMRSLVAGVRGFAHRGEMPAVAAGGVAELRELARAFEQLNHDLAASRDALVASERQAALGALVPVVAHNIRNPLASIRAAAQLIEADDDPRELLDSRDEIIATVDRLERWVATLLAYLHPLRPRCRTVALAAVIAGALQPLAHRLEAKHLRLQRHPWPEEETLDADPDLLEQALHGLLANAVEASPADGELAVGLYPMGDSVELWLEDRGPGLPFHPEPGGLHPGPTTKRFGTGLGIPFAFKVVQVHGGSLTFDPRPGGGTRVRLRLPRRPPEGRP
ncbi:MAG: ATP-binding protein, partial [Candidatus Competibacterales bacterium]|nr:ATP-binding protein [Candidatus Competibacterales bacterium]